MRVALAVRHAIATLLCAVPGLAPALTLTPDSAWTRSEISVCWEAMRPEYRQERDLIRKVVTGTWQRESAIRFTGWQLCIDGAPDIRISLETTYPRTAGRGRDLAGVARGVQLPPLWSLAALSINAKAPVHEFGHVLGFGHEYARADQPAPETCSVRLENGAMYSEADVALTPFDPDSVMVGCVEGATVRFSKGLPKLSALDIFGLVRTYGSNPENILGVDAEGDSFGATLLIEDFDGNGVQDLAVGAPGKHGGTGAVFLYRGDRVSGFRPWAVLEAEADSLGSSLTLQPAGSGPAAILARDAQGRAFEIRVPARGLPAINRSQAADGDPPPAPVRQAPPEIEVAAGFGFPDMEARAVVAQADLDGDQTVDLVIGLPEAVIGGIRSGAVVVVRVHRNSYQARRNVAWYWFGQAY